MPTSSYQNTSPMSTASTKVGTPQRPGRSQRTSFQCGGDSAMQTAPPVFQLPGSAQCTTESPSSDNCDPFSDHNAKSSSSLAPAGQLPRRSIYAGFPEYEEGYVDPAGAEPAAHELIDGQSKASGRKGSKAGSFASSSSTSTADTKGSKKGNLASRFLGKMDFKYQGYADAMGMRNPRSPTSMRNMGPGDPSAGCVIS